MTIFAQYAGQPGSGSARVRVATTASITLTDAQTIDGVSVVAGDRVLCKNQSTGAKNGIYVCAAGAWSRADDLLAGASAAGLLVEVTEGAVSADVQYVCTSNVGADVVGTDSIVFASGAVVDSLLVHLAGVETITGVKTMTSPVLNTPRVVTSLNDANGNEVIITPATASAVNEMTATNAATGTSPLLAASGGDADIGLQLRAKGTSNVSLQGSNGGNAVAGGYDGAGLVVGFFGAAPAVQPTAVADLGAFTDPPSAGEMATLRTQFNALMARLRTLGLIAT